MQDATPAAIDRPDARAAAKAAKRKQEDQETLEEKRARWQQEADERTARLMQSQARPADRAAPLGAAAPAEPGIIPADAQALIAEAKSAGADTAWINRLVQPQTMANIDRGVAAAGLLREHREAGTAYQAAYRSGDRAAIEAAYDRYAVSAARVADTPAALGQVPRDEQAAIAVAAGLHKERERQAHQDAEVVKALRPHFPTPAGAAAPLVRLEAAAKADADAHRRGDAAGADAARRAQTEAAVSILSDRQELAKAQAAGLGPLVRTTVDQATQKHAPELAQRQHAHQAVVPRA